MPQVAANCDGLQGDCVPTMEAETDRCSLEEVPTDCDSVPRRWTLSIALPGSILDNAVHKSAELQASLACQVARAAAVFCIDEIIVFREGPRSADEDSTDTLALLLRYMDTPQYLRRHLFPVSEKLKNVGSLNPLNLPNHFAKADTPRWRDGVAVPSGRSFVGRSKHDSDQTAKKDALVSRYVDVGLQRLVEVDQQVPLFDRVTVDLFASGESYSACPGKYLFGQIAHRSAPRLQRGLYWGYTIRVADSLLEALRCSAAEECEDKKECYYDLVVGTSERGAPIGGHPDAPVLTQCAFPEFSRGLIVFGGVHGLEHSARCDMKLMERNIGTSSADALPVDDLFDFYVNTCPRQGSRTIRTEEAIPISLAVLQSYLRPKA
jgi:methyltransferase